MGPYGDEWTSVNQWAQAPGTSNPSTGGSKWGCAWALVQVMPRPTTVSERLKTASKAAVFGLLLTVSSLIGVITAIAIIDIFFV